MQTIPIFSTDRTNYSWTWSDSNPKQSIDLKHDFPPAFDGQGTLLVTLTTAAGSDTIALKCYLGFFLNGSIVYGPAKTIKDENGKAITFSSGSATQVIANLYSQAWWTVADYIKIELSGNTGNSLAGQAAITLK